MAHLVSMDSTSFIWRMGIRAYSSSRLREEEAEEKEEAVEKEDKASLLQDAIDEHAKYIRDKAREDGAD